MHHMSTSIPVLPPYQVNADKLGHEQGIHVLLFFEWWETCSTFEKLVRVSTIEVLWGEQWLEEEVLQIIKKQYPGKILLPSSYMIWTVCKSIVALDVQNYWFLAFPWGKWDGWVLAELLGIRWNEISDVLAWATDLQHIVTLLDAYRVWPWRNLFKKIIHSLFYKLGFWLPNDTKLQSLLWFGSVEAQALFKKKLSHIQPSKWLDELLKFVPETFQAILHREYLEETGRTIRSHELRWVFLEWKDQNKNVLKVRMYYTGEVYPQDEKMHKHTLSERDAGITSIEIAADELQALMEKRLLQKMWITDWSSLSSDSKTKKLSTALWHYFAWLMHLHLQEKMKVL